MGHPPVKSLVAFGLATPTAKAALEILPDSTIEMLAGSQAVLQS
jgi:hypothetical protein